LLVEGDGAEEGDVDMAARREERDQRQQAAQDQGDPAHQRYQGPAQECVQSVDPAACTDGTEWRIGGSNG
jgi:hypothetical protein